MQFIKSLIFYLLFYFVVITVLIIAIPTLIMPKKFTLLFGKFLANLIILVLKVSLNVKVFFHGLDNLKKTEKFFVASAHQSLLETFILQSPLNFPIFILKKELLKIPLFGWYLKKIGSIEIVRETTTKDNLNFFEKIKNVINKEKRPLLIFPQGTRIKLGERVPFKKGAGKIYSSLNIPCIPVALNTGKIWPKSTFIKNSGTDIHISFLEPIMPGMDKNEFIVKLEKKIYSEIEKLG
tara:strand:+ start:360 stop:1070 length:711 start_codon:yes stop_codon:yes gene_type:complete